jgi:hypothetical protein
VTRYSARLIVFAEQDRVGRLLVGQPRPARTRNTGFRHTYAVNSASNDSMSRTTTLYHLHSRASLRSEDLPSSTTGPSSVFDDISAIAYPFASWSLKLCRRRYPHCRLRHSCHLLIPYPLFPSVPIHHAAYPFHSHPSAFHTLFTSSLQARTVFARSLFFGLTTLQVFASSPFVGEAPSFPRTLVHVSFCG